MNIELQDKGLYSVPIGHQLQERLDEMRRLLSIARCTGIEAYLLTPAEIKKIYPLMRVDDLAGALYSTGCGMIIFIASRNKYI